MKIVLELCELGLYKEIGKKIPAQRKDEVMRNIFDVS
jgi:hypothetical protein